MQVDGARVLLTGATGGIGHAIARELARRGAALLLTGRRSDVLEPLAAETGGTAIACDLSDRSAVTRLIEDAGAVDVLVANAAVPASGLLHEYATDQIDRALDVNLRAPILLAQELSRGMAERRRGHVVLISSLVGKSAQGGASLYSATKFGLRGFGLALRDELRPAGVGVSTVFPGFISDAGMFHEAGVELPRFVGTRRPEHVAAAVLTAIERNRAEVDVAPVSVRIGAMLSGLAPETASRVQRRLGGEDVSSALAERQRSKR